MPAGTYTGVVFEDYNANGVMNVGQTIPNASGTPAPGTIGTANDRGLQGITITATDSAGNIQGSTTSTANGTFSLNAAGTGPYRIQFSGLPAGFSPGPQGPNNGTTVQFVADGGAAGVSLGLVNPSDFNVDNPTVAAVNYIFGDQINGRNNASQVLSLFPYSSGATDPGANTGQTSMNPPAVQVNANQVGATFALAYEQARPGLPNGRLYAAAYTKLHTGYGPQVGGSSGNGTIYAIDPTTGTSTPFVNLNQLFGANTAGVDFRAGYGAGNTDPRYVDDSVLTNGAYVDPFTGVSYTSWAAVGKTALGGIAVSDDGNTLYAMNLADRTIYVIPTNLGRPVLASDITRLTIPSAALVPFATGATANNPLGDLQPFALTYYRGTLYVGIINSAESTTLNGTIIGDASQLRAYVYAVNPTTLTFGAAPVFMTGNAVDGGLDYPRAQAARFAGDGSGIWHAWKPSYQNTARIEAGRFVYAQPILTGIAFDANGNMVLGLRDRGGDQGGDFTPVDPANPGIFAETYPAGEIWQAFANGAGGWTLENNTSGPLAGQGPTTGAGLGTGPGTPGAVAPPETGPFGQYYYNQDFQPPCGGHGNVTTGGVANAPGFPDVIVNAYDPTINGAVQTGGLRWMNTTGGNEDKAYNIYQTATPDRTNATTYANTATNFGKDAGIGGVVLLPQNAPVEIGNRLWNDLNGNGIQDPGEPVLTGVTVDLFDVNNNLLATAITDAQGDYYFSNDIRGTNTASAQYGIAGLTANTAGFTVRLDNMANYVGAGPLAGLVATRFGAGANNAINSKGVTVSSTDVRATVNTGGPGMNNHTFDIGFVTPVALGDLVFNDANNDGILDNGETGVPNVTVNLLDQNGNLLRTTTTDGNGNYLFTGLAPNTYQVQIVPPAGFVTSTGINGSATGPFEPGVSGFQNNQDHGTAQPDGTIRAVQVTIGPVGSPLNPDSIPGGTNNANLRQDFGIFQTLGIGNFIWNDLNNNGKVDTGEPGIGGVTVNLVDQNGTLVATTTTNSQGGYLFTNLIPGQYRVVLPAVDFNAGGPLAVFTSSTGLPGSPVGPFEPAPNNNIDNQDKGTIVGTLGAGGFVQGGLINLQIGTQPTGETPTRGIAAVGLDANTNLTQDFGFFTLGLTGTSELSLTKTVSAPVVTLPGPETFTFTVRNNGPDTATNVLVSDPLPRGLVFLSATVPSQGSYDPNSGAWYVGTLANGATATLTVTVQVLFGGLFVNNAAVGSDRSDPVLANNVSAASFVGQLPSDQVSKQQFLTPAAALPPLDPVTLPGPALGNIGLIAVGADAGNLAQVNVFDRATGALRFSFLPFGTAFRGGVRVALGDVNGDGAVDVIAAAGPGGGPQVNVYDGRTGALVTSFFAFSPGFTGGVNIAAADVNGDGLADIITAAGAGGGPQVTVYNAGTFRPIVSFYAFSPGFTGGVNVAAADVTGTGRARIVVGAGAGGGPQVSIFDGFTGTLLSSYYAFNPSFRGGVYVAAGSINGDGRLDVIAGAGSGGGPQVTITDALTAQQLASYFAYNASFTGGVRVAAADVTGDGRTDGVTGAGPGGLSEVRTFLNGTSRDIDDFLAFNPAFLGGIYVAASRRR